MAIPGHDSDPLTHVPMKHASRFLRSRHVTWLGPVAFSLILVSAALNAAAQERSKLGSIPEFHPELKLGALQGYLDPHALPNSLVLVPEPPAPGSAAQANDEEIARNTFALRGTSRYAMAASDYDLTLPHLVNTFSCALNTTITKENAPYLFTLLSRAFTDLGSSTYAAKNFYKRTRPFQQNHEPSAVPEAEAFLAKDPSYPSGHTAAGWGFALILSELAPDRANEILARGRAFGESRIVCNHHWYSDVVWGRAVGAATVARLHADPTFRADMDAAREEFAALRRKGVAPSGDCNAEIAALAYGYQASELVAIDILLEPDAAMLEKCKANNARLLKAYPAGFALDATHTPHITLLQCFVRTADLEKVYAAEEKVFAAANVKAIKLEAFKYYYAPTGATGVAGICAKPTPELLKLQADVIAAARPFMVPTATIAAFTAPHNDAATDAAIIGYVSTFSEKMSGASYNPHVSTGVAPKEYLDKMLKERFKPFPFSPVGAAIFQLGPYGTAAKLLKRW